MSDRPAVLQIAQIGIEASAGTAVGASRKLRSYMWNMNPQAEVTEFRPSGHVINTITALNREWTEGDVDISLDYNELIYVLGSVLRAGSTLALGTASPASGGTATKWMYDPSVSAADTFNTYTMEYGDSNHASRVANLAFTGFSLEVSRQRVTAKAKYIATRLDNSITLGSTALYITHDSQRPIIPAHFDVYLDDTWAGLGGTKLTRDFNVKLEIDNRYSPIWPVNSANTSFAGLVIAPVKVTASLQLNPDATGTALYNTLRNGATKFMRLEAIGGTTAVGTVNYRARFDVPLQISSGPSASDADDLYVWEWQTTGIYDPTGARWFSAQVTNTLPAYQP